MTVNIYTRIVRSRSGVSATTANSFVFCIDATPDPPFSTSTGKNDGAMSISPILSLKEQYGPESEAWQEQTAPPIVRFWTDDGICWAIPFSRLPSCSTIRRSRACSLNARREQSL